MSDGTNSIADDILRNGFERWQRLEGEKQAISDDLKELFAELKSQGFDGKALRASFRVVAKAGVMAVEEHNALVDLYVGSLMGPVAPEVGTVPATRSRAAREAETEDRADALATLRADPAMAIVEAANLKKPEPQLTKAAGSDLASAPQGQVAEIQPETANEIESGDRAVTGVGPGSAVPTGRAETDDDQDAALAATPQTDKPVEASASAAPVLKYAAPGVVTWETHPPEGVERGAISTAFGTMGQDAAVIADELGRGAAQPIVKKGNVILDGWARYMAARNMRELDGSPMAYPVVQYAGSDILIDMIKLNVEGRILTEQQKRLIAANLSRQQPKRKDDIYRAFELWMEPV